MVKRISRRIAVILTMAMMLTSFVYAAPVHAASKPDLKKANVSWDLKNNKTLKYKTKWYALGVKEHTVKMTKFKVKNSKKKGYKECTFTLTFNRKIKPNSNQINKMFFMSDGLSGGSVGDNGPFGGGMYFTVVDYKTGKSLEGKNNKRVKVTSSKWKYTQKETKVSSDGFSIWYARKATVKVKIVYPKKYKNLAIGVGGYTATPETWTKTESWGHGGIGVASATGGIKTLNLKNYWSGKIPFSKETRLYSKKSKKYAHFMRVK